MMLRSFFAKYSDLLVLFLLPLFFVFHGFTDNFPSILLQDAAYLLLVYEVAVFAFALLVSLVLKNRTKASLFTFLFFCLFFFFGALHDLIKQIFSEGIVTKYSCILPAIFIAFTLLFYFIKKSAKSFFKIFTFFSLLLSILLVVDMISLGWSKASQKHQTTGLPARFKVCDTCTKPDIYLIVADEYAGQKELKEVMNFDNSAFENQLKNLGFHIVKNAKSNYNYTPFSAASLFSMQYLNGIEGLNFSKKDRKLCNQLLNNNAFIDYLKSIGYSINNYSVFGIDQQQPIIATSFIATSKELLTRQTLLGRIYLDLGYHLITTFKIKPIQESSIYNQLNGNQFLINKTIEESKVAVNNPRFTYTHLMMPHYPYYFNKDGKPYPFETLQEGQQTNQERYIEYLQYSNRFFLNLISQILKNSKKEPIIIFMGDHGFRHFNTPVDTAYHFLNLNSILLPGKDYKEFYDGMSSVNMFRVFLNSQFKQQLPLLKDSTIFIQE